MIGSRSRNDTDADDEISGLFYDEGEPMVSTADGSKPKPRSNNQTSRSFPVSKSTRVMITAVPKADHSKSSSSFSDSKQFVCSTCHKCVFNANHDACITKLLKEVNSRAKIQSHKTRNSNKPVDQKSYTQKPGRQIFIGHRFSPNKTSAVYEKTSPRSDLRWKPTGRIFKSIGLRWIPTGKLFDSCTSKVHQSCSEGIKSLDLSADDDTKDGRLINNKIKPRTSMSNAFEKTGQARTTIEDEILLEPTLNKALDPYALAGNPVKGDSLNQPDHRFNDGVCSLINESDS
ncbi:hypothetical protein Tco_0563378 [Tanacetum coccineum]